MPATTFELPPQYAPHEVEARLYDRWLEAQAFHARADSPKPPYVIVIPPPNVTGVLHMGHGMNNTIQDVLIRCARMRGREALWVPGTDHAGIATQNVVERQLAREGKTRFDLGRDQFVERVWTFVRETGGTILKQLRTIGCSCDWSRTRFTLDPAYTRAVREAFVRLWEEKLIYRGHRVIHWCPRCLTALSDEEAEFQDETGALYYIRYPIEGSERFLTVATTRPETMLGDTAVAVNPDDERHRDLVGKRARVPIANVVVPIIADRAVDPKFGTGFVKVTPAHDANDFEIGQRHGLDAPLIMREDGTMGGNGGSADGRMGGSRVPDGGSADGRMGGSRVPDELVGVDRFEARKKIVAMLKNQGLLEKTEQHQHGVRHCYRCDTVVEPRLSDQWFVRMKPLAEPALRAFHSGEVRIIPERWEATYQNWMEHIRDWNISRQLWWGHRIPIFTCTRCGEAWADRADPTSCRKCGGPVAQDPDVLDTWFSSWLWPFATLGWPDETPDLAHFYPGTTLVTDPNILFFWVARMIMAGFHFMGRKPFSTVYLHGTARDMQHRRMSKSLGNGIDPLDVVQLFSADALRWTLIAGSSLGADIVLNPDDLETTFAPGRNFANKLWNIGRFVLAQLNSGDGAGGGTAGARWAAAKGDTVAPPAELTLADRWILSRLQATIREVTSAFEQFRLDEGAKRCFDFVWKELADWYVEAVKPRIASDASSAQTVLVYCLDVSLRLLHPVVPFITEELWQRLPGRAAGELLVTARWPEVQSRLIDERAEREFALVQESITASRNLRAEYKVPPKIRTPFYINPPNEEVRKTLDDSREMIILMSGSANMVLGPLPNLPGGYAVLTVGAPAFVELEGFIDVQQECRRLSGERSRLDQQLTALAAKLSNENFVSRAPADVVAREREKERDWRFQRDVLDGKLKSLGCS